MRHFITYTARDGTAYDLSGATGADALLSWDPSLSAWDYDVASSTGALSLKPAECAAQILVPRGSLDGLVERLYQDAGAGGGTLSVDGWERVVSARTGSYDKLPGGDALVSLTLRSQDPLWRRITTRVLMPGSAETSALDGLDYPTDYPFDYAGASAVSSVGRIEHGATCIVRATFFGPCEDPYVRVTSRGDEDAVTNLYGVGASAEAGERIVIDPLGRSVIGGSVYKVGAYGERTNLYGSRRRGTEGSGSYVFERLPPGAIEASWPQGYGVTLDLIEERGSLPWT